VSIFAGQKVGCIDVHLLNLACDGKIVSVEVKRQSASSRLQVKMKP
jgi:hypothetical protein